MRTELRALTPDTLAELTNRGLVKRATREIDRAAPTLTESPGGTVTATFDDAVVTTLPPGGLDAAHCTCGATATCRHVVALILTYQRQDPPTTEAPPPVKPPGGAPAGPPAADPAGASAELPADVAAELPARAATDPPTGASAGLPTGAPAAPLTGASPEPPAAAGAEPSGGTDGEAPTDASGLPTEVPDPPSDAPGPATETPGSDAENPAPWSPGDFTDDELAARIGARMVAAARRVERAGYVARVHRARPGDPVAGVELPTATVRFLVPGNLSFARSDAVAGVRDDVIALAVWAFREADRVAPGAADVQVQVGGTASATGSGLDAALALAGLVLREGAVHVGAGLAADVAVVRRTLEAGRLRWPLLAVEDLVGQLDAYRQRSARYRPEALADHLAELHARHRAVTGGGASLRSRVLGTDEASETPLRRARLDGLGCRVTAVGAERVVEVYLAHADSASVLVLRRSYETDDPGPALAARRVAGVSVGALAAGVVVTESAVRSASRTVRLGARRLSRTEAMRARGSWTGLPGALLAPDLAVLAAELDALAPRPVRARIEAELVRVVPVAEVRSVSYAPGSQRLDAVIADAGGRTAVVSATHAACAPGRLDSMAAALSGGELHHVAGSVRRGGGGVLIDPIGFAVGDVVVVPDLAPAEHAADPDAAAGTGDDALGAALDEGLALLAEVAHRGLLHVPSTMPGRLRAAARRLGSVGLRRSGEAVEAFAGQLGPDPGDAAVQAWVDAHLRLSVAADMR